jgi:hypothetical protein
MISELENIFPNNWNGTINWNSWFCVSVYSFKFFYLYSIFYKAEGYQIYLFLYISWSCIITGLCGTLWKKTTQLSMANSCLVQLKCFLQRKDYFFFISKFSYSSIFSIWELVRMQLCVEKSVCTM